MEAPVPIYITLPAEYFPVNVSSMLEIDMGKQEQRSAVAKTVGKKPIVVASAPSEKRPMPLSENKPLAPAEPQSSVGSDDDECSSMDELMSRGKKRRLDHLTWEEKLQRKKLKNRVAAQTSRDRKKAKMEEMEKTIQEQADQISELQDRCSALASEKSEMHGKYLSLERRFEELQRRLEAQEKDNGRAKNGILHRVGQSLAAEASDDDGGSVGCATAGRLSGSAAGTEQRRSGGSADDTPLVDERRAADGPVEDHCHLPTLQDMLEDFDVSKLEELAESLLAGVGADLEGADRPGSPADAEGGRTGQCLPRPVVGPAAAIVESGGPAAMPADSGSRLILTTHNYSKSPFYELSDPEPKAETPSPLPPPAPLDDDKTILSIDSDTLYGTYDNETNCITIVLANDDEYLQQEEVKSEPASPAHPELREEETFTAKAEEEDEMPWETNATASALEPIFIRPPSPLQDLLSPIAPALKSPGGFSSVSSDCGYESLGSPVPSINWSTSLFAVDEKKPSEKAPATQCPTAPGVTSVPDFSDSTAMSLDYALNDFDEFWNLDLFPILE